MFKSPMRKIKISIRAVALGLVLVAGPAAGVAQAATVRYPDTDIVTLKTTGGFVGGNSFRASAVTWNSAKGYTRNLYMGDDVKDGRCMTLSEFATFADGTTDASFTQLQKLCDPSVAGGSTETRVYSNRTSTKAFKSLKIKLCRLTTAGVQDNCVVTTVYAGID